MNRVNHTQVAPSLVEHFDFTMKGTPRKGIKGVDEEYLRPSYAGRRAGWVPTKQPTAAAARK